MEGSLDKNGKNFSAECGKTYFIEMEYPNEADAKYGLRQLKVDVPSALPAGAVVAFRKAIRGGGEYGSESYTGELLVRPTGNEKQSFKIRLKNSEGVVESDQVTLEKTLANGLQIWRFAVGSYGKINFDSIVYGSGDKEYLIEVINDLIQ